MSTQQWALVIALAFALISAGALSQQWASVIAAASALISAGALYYARRGARVAERQLELAEMQPVLEVDVRLLEPRNIEAMPDVVRRRLGAVPRANYDGPPPNKFIQAVVVNVGSIAAYEVTGWLSFNTAYWEPLPYFVENTAIKETQIIGDISDGRL